jgi:hypothetical protein
MKKVISNKDDFINTINGLTAEGGTNTGDGIRRGYHSIVEFNAQNENKTNKNFMIILVDGVTTLATATEYNKYLITSYRYYDDTINYKGRIYDYIGWYYDYDDYEYVYEYVYYNNITYLTGNVDVTSDDMIIGVGSRLDRYGTEYVDEIGEMVRSYKNGTNEAINVFVIGFSEVVSDYGSLEDIAMATRGDKVYYKADSQKALEEIFSSIQREISDALWHIGGPN